MTLKGWGVNERHADNPINSHLPRGKDTSERRHRNDPGWTGTEERMRNQLLRQFMRSPEGSAHSDVEAYKGASCWCSYCGGRRLVVEAGRCENCLIASDRLIARAALGSREFIAGAPDGPGLFLMPLPLNDRPVQGDTGDDSTSLHGDE